MKSILWSSGRRCRLYCCTTLAIVVLASGPAGLFRVVVAAGPFFQGLGQLDPGSIVQNAGVRGISSDGSFIVGSAGTDQGVEAFRWSLPTGMIGLGDLPGGEFRSSAQGVTADGVTVVGYSRSQRGEEAFRWTAVEGIIGLGDLPERPNLSFVNSQARDISVEGSVVVGAGTSQYGTRQAVQWTSAGIEGLGYLQGDAQHFSEATGVSADGRVIIGRAVNAAGEYVPFRWTVVAGMVELGNLPGALAGGTAEAVCGNGAVVGTALSANGVGEAYRWAAAEGMVGLGDIAGGDFASHAYGCSADGLVIVGFGVAPTGRQAAIWDPVNGMRSLPTVLAQEYGLNLTGWELQEARSVSADGRTIAGDGFHNGRAEAWVAVLIPEPATNGLCLMVIASLATACAIIRRMPRRGRSAVRLERQ